MMELRARLVSRNTAGQEVGKCSNSSALARYLAVVHEICSYKFNSLVSLASCLNPSIINQGQPGTCRAGLFEKSFSFARGFDWLLAD